MAGLFGLDLEGMTTNPLFLGGAGLLTGEGFGGALKGMQAGSEFQQRRRKQAEQDDQKQRWGQYTSGNMGGLSPEMAALVRAAGPQGVQYASEALSQAPKLAMERDKLAMERDRLQLAQSADSRAATMQNAQLQQLKLQSPEEKLAWLRQNIPNAETPENRRAIATAAFNGSIAQPKDGPLETAIAKTSVDMAEGDIKAGYGAQTVMGDAARLRELTKDRNFEAAIGPIAGTSTYQTAVNLIPFSQTIGLNNPALHQQIEQTKQQVIQSAQQRLKGLGPMSDQDAARVEKAVGTLEKARNKTEFLNAVTEIERSVEQTLTRARYAAQKFPQLGGALNVTPPIKPGSGYSADSVGEGTERVLGEKVYIRRNGQWYEK